MKLEDSTLFQTMNCIFDFLICIAYFSIPVEILIFGRKFPDISYTWKAVLWLFVCFILLCGTTHLVNAWNMWWKTPVVMLLFKILTAVVSLYTSAILIFIIPKALEFPAYARNMEIEIAERIECERDLSYQNRLLGLFRNVSHEIRQTLDGKVILETLCQQIIKNCHAEQCSVYVRESHSFHEVCRSIKRRLSVGSSMDQTGGKSKVMASKSNSTDSKSGSARSLLGYQRIHDSAPQISGAFDEILLLDDLKARKEHLMVQSVGSMIYIVSCFKGGASKDYQLIIQFSKRQPTSQSGINLSIFSRSSSAWPPMVSQTKDIILDILEQVTIAMQQASMIKSERGTIEKLNLLNQSLQAAQKEVKVAQAQREFLAVMSHEMRTPLFSTSALTQMLLDSNAVQNASPADAIELKESLTMMKKSSDMLASIVNNILDFSKYEEDKINMTREVFSPRDALENVMDILFLQQSDDMHKLPSLTYKIEDGLDPTTGKPRFEEFVVGDFTRFRQILLNLAGNAVKFTPPDGHVIMMLSSRTVDDSGKVRYYIDVKDTGIGIPQQAKNKLFETFYQVDRSITRKYGGTGLGLAIVKKLVECMGGVVTVHDNEDDGVGTRFHAEVLLESYVPSQWPDLSLRSFTSYESTKQFVDINATFVCADKLQCGCFISCMSALNVAKIQTVNSFDDAFKTAFNVMVIDLQCLAHEQQLQVIGDRHMWNKILITGTQSQIQSWQKLITQTAPDCTIIYTRRPAKIAVLYQFLTYHLTGPQDFAGSVMNLQQQSRSTIFHNELPRLRILLAEDNVISQKVLKKIFDKLGQDCIVASNGQEAIDLWEQHRDFDIFFTDLMMPIKDGIEAAGEITRRCSALIQQQQQNSVQSSSSSSSQEQYSSSQDDLIVTYKKPWIIAITANAFWSDRLKCLEAGMNDFIQKPAQVAEIKKAILNFIAQKKDSIVQ
ncbi:hypothetical protein MIR68_008116 [Amoeboaphelidium protococcarum]|nr:hypothetical protein MIR68_008116 [Amoeboaphelidium protococcarum]